MSWIKHCSIQLAIILRSYCLLGLHDRIVALNSPYVERAGVNNTASQKKLDVEPMLNAGPASTTMAQPNPTLLQDLVFAGVNQWILLHVAICTIMAISRMTSRVLYSAQYHRQHCTLQAFEQFGALYMHIHDDKYPARPGFESGTSTLQAPVDTNEPSGPALLWWSWSILQVLWGMLSYRSQYVQYVHNVSLDWGLGLTIIKSVLSQKIWK